MFLHSGETNDRGELGVTSAFFCPRAQKFHSSTENVHVFRNVFTKMVNIGGRGRGDSLQRAKKYTLASYFHIFSNQHLGYRTQDGVNKK